MRPRSKSFGTIYKLLNNIKSYMSSHIFVKLKRLASTDVRRD
ncbi:hypothetical protein LEP1GSC084_0265 [Leptospira interrogans serovar Medanensis str. L0448]|uniref:Uncharacterized protein n=1 Tax=Leptospira interrogans str. UI 12621 TaxID=1049937 RepID=A0A0F6H8H1_LEPIR|nr:hypothetical protein LEP1GSC104_0790 [Leptospira interrogans str. UI 12621]EKR83373.1 hypothetical protein LEP1GSC099_1151 [Leptospira interrogans str. UI 08452]EMN37245.1 hypothetical protein LEP1GSC084_0265 [Leptospira interrogans serovar Medanensis str. L0448]EMN39914.1 hypothetical protein LEP1GSC085_4702 [Leptospira interrogans str. L0996]EMN64916.1 hypothetical protein LEP1GSC098_2160 [Leptospira interrogans serovar Grippotyphosa str. UI 08434]EMN96080.1 hypothetical protein LEP1GSC11